MSRATDILAQDLPDAAGTFTLRVITDSEGAPLQGSLDNNNMPEHVLWYLATKMRPIIFLDGDPISYLKLLSAIEAEHPNVRGNFVGLRATFTKWQRDLIIGAMDLGPVPTPVDPSIGLISVWSGPVGTLPPGVNLEGMVSDFEYAKIYFNGMVWHSDVDKAAAYEAAGPLMKSHMAKCAELRTLSAIPFIQSLHGWILQARTAGEDF